jgi:regulator of protease activity HflC (stomatin/prohibitin superfamily)
VTAGIAALMALVVVKLMQVRRRPVEVGTNTIVGTTGVVRGEGMVFVNGELWQARLGRGRAASNRRRGRDRRSRRPRVDRAAAPRAHSRIGSRMVAALILIGAALFILLIFLSAAVKVAREYERGVVFRLGRLLQPPKGPGLFLLIPVIDRMVRVDLRTITLNVPPQEVITKDNVPVRVNAVAYFRIVDPAAAIVQIENFMVATSQIAQTTLRSVLGQHLLDELLSERDKINAILQQIIDEATAPWGIKVSIVEVKDVEIPTGMQRAMARQAEAERERRAKVIAAEGEFQASERLKDAARCDGGSADRAPAPLPTDAARARAVGVDDDRLPGADRPDQAVRSRGQLSGELRVDPLSGRQVVVAPGRSKRPGAGWPLVDPPTEAELESCPFCAGREDRTPPETLTIGDPWRIRVVPNLYPAFERQEVVVHSPEHVRTIADLEDDQLALVAEAWRTRREQEPAGYLHALVNEGKAAGGSLAHSHSQLVWLARTPPAVEKEQPFALDGEPVLERDGVAAVLPRAGRVPYEGLVAPVDPEPDAWTSERLATALQLLAS